MVLYLETRVRGHGGFGGRYSLCSSGKVVPLGDPPTACAQISENKDKEQCDLTNLPLGAIGTVLTFLKPHEIGLLKEAVSGKPSPLLVSDTFCNMKDSLTGFRV